MENQVEGTTYDERGCPTSTVLLEKQVGVMERV